MDPRNENRRYCSIVVGGGGVVILLVVHVMILGIEYLCKLI